MARRKRLIAPDTKELEELHNTFDPGPLERKSAVPPIAHVARETAQENPQLHLPDRVEIAQNQEDAKRFRAAQQDGLIVSEIALKDIADDYLQRDRLEIDREELDELKASIRLHGQRSPIEVIKLERGQGALFGLISGARRLTALKELAQENSQSDPKIKALVRDPHKASDAYVAMVEENEIRTNLSHYERGRIAAVASAQKAFDTVEEAVDQLFAAASKAKRSKIRSFAAIHDALGDVLSFPTALSERAGLQVAQALRDGAEAFRQALADAAPSSASDEWKALEAVIKAQALDKDQSRGGRPSKADAKTSFAPLALKSGGQIKAELYGDTLTIKVTGQGVETRKVDDLLKLLKKQADKF